MPFIDVPLSDAKEGKPVPEGEYELRIISAEREISKAAKERGEEDPNMTHVMIVIEDGEYPNALPMHEYLLDVSEDDEESIKNMRELNIARLLQVFDVPYEANGYDSDDLPGATGRCLVILAPAQGQYDERNELRLPRLKGE